MVQKIKKDLAEKANPEKAETLQRYFKTEPGGYGEGDIFLGISVPETRKVAKKYYDISLYDIQRLLSSKIHEERAAAIHILVEKFEKGSGETKKKIFKTYLDNSRNINGWDLVDMSADKIVGSYLSDKQRLVLYKLAKSKILWERRIAVIATFHFIKNNDFKDAIKIFEILLNDNHDLIHKAVGWMLREIGKRDPQTEEMFLEKHYKKMPRVTMRYAIEKFPEKKRKKWLLK